MSDSHLAASEGPTTCIQYISHDDSWLIKADSWACDESGHIALAASIQLCKTVDAITKQMAIVGSIMCIICMSSLQRHTATNEANMQKCNNCHVEGTHLQWWT